MAPDSACGVAQSTARSNAEFEAKRFRKGFRKGCRRKRESVVESNDACSSRGSERARAVISSAKWLRGTPEQRFREASGFGARPSSDFERKARPVRCFRVLSALFHFFQVPIGAEDLLYNIQFSARVETREGL